MKYNKNPLAELNLPIFHIGTIFAVLIVLIYCGIAGMTVFDTTDGSKIIRSREVFRKK